MKNLLIIILLLISPTLFSQPAEDEQSAKKLVTDFFDAFHQQDTLKFREFAHPDMVLQSISVQENEENDLKTYSYAEFLKGVSEISGGIDFEEILHDFNIQINGAMATVNTPYTFMLNGERSHCGVNTFQLMKEDDEWKIIYLVDTRMKSGCKDY